MAALGEVFGRHLLDDVSDWFLSQLKPVSSETASPRVLAVHPSDGNLEEQQRLASILQARLPSPLPSLCHFCCSIWGGLDRQVESEQAFADEQSLGFAIDSLIECLEPNGLVVLRFSNESVRHGESSSARILDWLNNFGVVNVEYSFLDGFWLIKGRKAPLNLTPKPLRLGLLLSERKSKKILSPKFIQCATNMGIQLVTTKEPANIVLTKVDSFPVVIPPFWERALVVDSPLRIPVLNNRMETETLAKSCLASFNQLFFPTSTLDPNAVVSFPVLAKPNDASAHTDLWFVKDRESLAFLPSVPGGFFYQKCIDHGPVLFKVSMIGKELSIARRPSAVPSLKQETSKLTRKGDEHPRKSGVKKNLDPSVTDAMQKAGPSYPLVVKMAQALQVGFGLHLIGFDLIVESLTNKVYLVDINYFPSFADVPARERVLLRTLWELALEKGKV